MADGTGSPPAMPPEALAAITAPRAPDAPRRCFICLVDAEPSDPPGSWVDPCPCTLEAHQDCMMSWVTDCERSNKPLRCPVCKSDIEMEGPWDPIVAFSDAVQRRFTRASPILLMTGVSAGIQFSAQMYGAVALCAFAGQEAMMDFMFGPDHDKPPGQMFANAAILTNVAPALLISQLLPGLGNKIFVPTASLYGMYHVMHDDGFVSWPPSPQLAMAVFPYIRSLYYNLYREFVLPHEMNLNRQLLGLPPIDDARQPDDGREQQARNAERNGEGGVVGFLQGVLDALDPDDEDGQGGDEGGDFQIFQNGADGGEGNDNHRVILDVEVVIEGEQGDDDDVDPVMEEDRGDEDEEEDLPDLIDPPPNDEDHEREGAAGHEAIRPEDEEPDQQGQQQEQEQGAAEAAAAEEQLPPQNNHDVPPAPPANRVGLGTVLSNFSNQLLSALILPGMSFAMGEALRVALPARWTQSSLCPFRKRPPGLLQQQWGRSLVGGCLYVVIKDVIRVYSKHRKVAAMGNRRVKNVDRPRRNASSSR